MEWDRGRVFDQDAAAMFQRFVLNAGKLRVDSVTNKEERRQRPHGAFSLHAHTVFKLTSVIPDAVNLNDFLTQSQGNR